jgi:thioredoxin 2
MMVYACSTCGGDNRIPASRLDRSARCGHCKAALLPIDRPYDVPDVATFEEVIRESPLPVVVDLWAQWCGPCHAVAPELRKLALAQAGRAVLVKVDTDRFQEIAQRFEVRAIPMLLRFDRGRETKRVSGAQPAETLNHALGLEHEESGAHATG